MRQASVDASPAMYRLESLKQHLTLPKLRGSIRVVPNSRMGFSRSAGALGTGIQDQHHTRKGSEWINNKIQN